MKEHERAAIEKAEKLTAELEKSPILRALRADEAAETLAKRTAAAAKIEDLKLDLEACGVIRREIDDMAAKLADMDAEREKMKTAINEKAYCLAREKSGIEGAIRREEEILLANYPPAIDEAEKFFRDLWESLLTKSINKQERHGPVDIFTQKKKLPSFQTRALYKTH